MKKAYILFLAFTLFLSLLMAVEKTDVQKKDLKGKVRKLSTENTVYYFMENGYLESESYDYDEYYCGDVYYSYDGKGRLTSLEDEDYYDGTIYSETYTYDDKDRVKTKKYTEYADDITITYTYDVKGFLVEERSVDQDGALVRRKEYINDKNGNKINEKQFDSEDKLERYFEFKYDKNNNKIEEALFNPDRTLQNKHEYSYNANNKLIKETGWNSTAKTYTLVLSYDDKGNEIKREYTDLATNKTTVTVTGYVYDEKGNWKEKTTAVLDGIKETINRSISYYEN